MRRILIEHARRRTLLKRGGGLRKASFHENIASQEPSPEEMIALDQALTRLESFDSVMCQVFKLRCFAGLTVQEVANALDTSQRTVDRNWAAARAWLQREVKGQA